MPMLEPDSPCVAQRLNEDCLASIFYEDVLAEDPLGMDELYREWSKTRDRLRCGELDEVQTNRGKALIRLSHVCRKWREVSLGLAPLWATLVAQFMKWYPDDGSELILRRSRGCPLSFILLDAIAKTLTRPMVRELTAKFAQYGNIMVNLNSTSIDEWMLDLLCQIPNRLRKVMLVMDGGSPHPDRFQQADLLDLAPRQLPVATHIILDGFYMPFLAPNLTCLVINVEYACLSARRICDILLNTPLLEILSLIQRSASWDGDDWPSDGIETRLMSLPHLTSAKIWGFIDDITSFLLRMDTSDSVLLDIGVCYYGMVNSESNSYDRFMDALRPYMESPSLEHLTVCDSSVVGDKVPPFFSLSSDLGGPKRLSVRVSVPLGHVMNHFRRTFERLTPGQIRTMFIEDYKDRRGTALPNFTRANDAFYHDVLNQYIEELCFDAADESWVHRDAFGNVHGRLFMWGDGLLPDFLLQHPEKYPALRRITVRGGSNSHNSWPSDHQLRGMRSWLDSRAQARLAMDSLQLEGHVPEGASTSLSILGNLMSIVDRRHTVAPAPQ